jgi:dienelactone hydrolase
VISKFRAPIAAALAVLVAAGVGLWLLAAPDGMSRRHVVVDGVPLDEVRPSGALRPGVVVAHGFAGSAKLMAQFGDSLAARGYVVVLLDFAGHGASRRTLPDGTASTGASTATLQHDLDVAAAHLRRLPEVDPSRIALVGHSMGASAVTRYAVAHPEITATVAMSLPDSSMVLPDRPKRLLLLVGALEFPGFHTEARLAAERSGGTRVVVPFVEHISILYAPRTHREIADWLDEAPGPAPPAPFRRVIGATILLLALAAGLYPLARLLFGAPTGSWPRLSGPQLGLTVAVAAVATGIAAVVAVLLPSNYLPLALGSYVVGFTATAGAGILAYARRRPSPPAGPSRRRVAVATPVLLGYAAATIAVPLHLGLTHTIPVGARWWLLAVVWAGFAVLAFAAERLTAGDSLGVLAVSAVAVIGLTGAAAVGFTSGFVLLVVPLLGILLLWQAAWSAVLHRYSAPSWLISLVGSLIVAWPLATTLPVIG